MASNKTLNPYIKTDYHHYYTMKKIIEAPGNFTCWFLSKRENVYRKYTTRTTVDEMSIIYDIANNRALKIDDLFISGKEKDAVVWGIMQKGELVSEQVDYAKRGNLFNENFCEEFGMDHFSGSPYFGGGTFLTTDYMTVHGETVPPNSELFFPAGHEGFTQYLDTFIKYPADAKKENIEGTVTLSFTVKAFTGDVSDIVVEKSAHPLLDKEAVRVINEMPRCTYWPGGQPRWTWIPGTKSSIPSDMRMECQVPFYLKKQNN